MKKLLRITLIAALALLLAAAIGTALAESDDDHWHFATCDNPTVCAVCGQPYSGDDIVHDFDRDTPYESDATHHWHICTK